MRLKEIKEAQEWRDESVRKEAHRILENLILILDSIDHDNVADIIDTESMFKNTVPVIPISPEVIQKKIGIRPFTLLIVTGHGFLPPQTGAAYMPKEKAKKSSLPFNTDIIAIVTSSNNVDANADTKKIVSAIKEAQEVIVEDSELRSLLFHEIVHYLDNIRTDVFKKENPANNEEEYFNSPEELNAHYNQMVSMIEEELEDYSMDAIDSLENFEDFFSYAKSKMGHSSNIFIYINNKNLRKFKKRLYNFWKQAKEDYLGE